MKTLLMLEADLAAKQALRAKYDERVRALSAREPGDAEDVFALQDDERSLEDLRHEVNALDVAIADLEGQIAVARGEA